MSLNVPNRRDLLTITIIKHCTKTIINLNIRKSQDLEKKNDLDE
jgi:hypothetical protein